MNATTTLLDVNTALRHAAAIVEQFLDANGVPATADGFYCVGLSGDEDKATQEDFTVVYGPLANLRRLIYTTLNESNLQDRIGETLLAQADREESL